MQRKFRSLVVVLIVLAVLVACRAPTTPSPTPAPAKPTPVPTPVATPKAAATPIAVAPKPTGELRIALTDFGTQVPAPWLDFAFGKSYLRLIYDPLVGITDSGDLSPKTGAAERWEMAPDGMAWTFYLRKGIKFHNGDELTAEDVKFSIEKITSPASKASYAGTIRAFVKEIEVVDPYKLVIRAKKPAPLLPWDLSDVLGTEGMIMPKKYAERVGDDEFIKNPVGTGPYRVKEQVIGSYLFLEATDQHWREGVPQWKRISFLQVPEESTRIAMLKRGEADIIAIARERAAEVKGAGFNIFSKAKDATLGLYIHQQWDPVPIADKRVRQALNLALNREEIAKFVFAGMGVPASIYPFTSRVEGILGLTLPPYPYDPERAKRLLKEAGQEGFELKMYSYPRADVPELPRFILVAADAFSALGVKPKIIATEYTSYREKRLAKTLPGEMGGLAVTYTTLSAQMSGLRTLHHSTGTFTSTKDPQLDKMIEEAEVQLQEAEMKKKMIEIYKYLYEQNATLTAVHLDVPYAAGKKVTQWDLGGAAWDQNWLYLIRR